MQSSVSCDVIVNPKVVKFLHVSKLGSWLLFEKKSFSSVKKGNFKKIIFDGDVMKTSRTPL